jgi:DNA-binding NarL/FixJ family response regulator
VRDFLEAKTPYRVCDEADDGLTAIQKAEASRCDLVLLDVAMPGLNGIETASMLRDRLPQLKIVGFSALARDVDLRDQLLATRQFDVVLSKFDGLEQLVNAIKALLARPN